MPDMIAFFTHFGHKILLFLHFMFDSFFRILSKLSPILSNTQFTSVAKLLQHMLKVATFSSTMFQESYCNNPLKICYGPIASIELQKRWTEWAKKLNCIF